MKRKAIEKVEPKKVRKKGMFITSQRLDEYLIVDFYKDKKETDRYVIDISSGEYGTYADGDWSCHRLAWITDLHDARFSWDRCKIKYKWYKDEDKELVENSLKDKKTWIKDWEDKIESIEREYNAKKRDNAWNRKEQRINDLMAQVPELPRDFDEWCHETIWNGAHYAFCEKKSKWKYHCTACGQTHELERKKHNEMIKCPVCGKDVQIKTRTDHVEKNMQVMVLSKVGSRSVQRVVSVSAYWCARGLGIGKTEEIRKFFGDKKTMERIYYTASGWYSWTRTAEWWDSNPSNRRCGDMVLYPFTDELDGTVEEEKRDALQRMCGSGVVAKYGHLLRMIDKKGVEVLEYLIKHGFKRMAAELGDSIDMYSGRCYIKLNLTGTKDTEIFGIDKQRVHRIKAMDGGNRELKWLQYEAQKGLYLKEDVIEFFVREKIEPSDIDWISDRMSPVKVKNYLIRQQAEYKRSYAALLGLWKDYLDMAKKLKYDVNDQMIYRTSNLIDRHDLLVEKINEKADELMADEMREKCPKTDEALERIKGKYDFENDEYIVSAPGTIEDIVRNMKELHMCGAGTVRYYERIARHETYILFLRKKEEPTVPYYTLEIQPGGTIRQKRAEYNRQPDIEKITKFLKEWQQEVKKRIGKEERELEKQSNVSREREMKELLEVQKNERLHQILAEDLLEAI